MKLLEMGKDMKIKHSNNKVWGNFFRKKALHEGANFFLQIYRGAVLHGDMINHARGKVNGLEVSQAESS